MQDILFNYANLDIRAASVFDLDVGYTSADPSSSYAGSIVGVKLGVHHVSQLLSQSLSTSFRLR